MLQAAARRSRAECEGATVETIELIRQNPRRGDGRADDRAVALPPPPDSAISSIAAIYLHLAMVNDAVTHGLYQGQPPLYARDGWGARLGAPSQATFDQEWVGAFRCDDPTILRRSGQAVQAAVDQYLASTTATAADLDRVLRTPFGERGYGESPGRYYLIHTMQHTGRSAR